MKSDLTVPQFEIDEDSMNKLLEQVGLKEA